MQNTHMLSIILKHDFLTSYNFTSFFSTDITPGNYIRKDPIISLFFHHISPSNTDICVHFSNSDNKLSRRNEWHRQGLGSAYGVCCSSETAALAQAPGLGTAGVATGSLQVLMHEVKRLLLGTDTTWEAGRETYAWF